ncbi:DUF5000 domain-containing lipoprotein [Pinibacter aurantiacus]|uniref:DUF4959 domain-containing protein n=1 Tax=Pinibacter aurantiacus TaxID=2851599 RepID=A0A9E2SAA8_9BACT|nr:DUF5000 domain-containing lipoprotein [Pinibacter aurantiacus]MBV4357539.1 DUF4959 domain-containing protein [Pinibacter aurantiacus]
MGKLNLYILSFSLLAFGCKQETLNSPIVTNSNAPGTVANVKVVNENGKASITYSLPTDKDLQYVKAVYETSPGVAAQVIASRYANNLTVDGFGDTLAHTIKLYSVNSSEVASTPVDVTVQPLTPGYILARRSLEVNITFGGFTIKALNPTGDNLAIIPMVDTTGKGNWGQTTGMDNVYSADTVITATIRNQPSVERKYAFAVRDRWFHYSDTLFLTLTPLFEQQLDKSKFATLVLPHDATVLNNGGYTWPYYMYDGNYHPGWPSTYFTVESSITPQMVTLDLGAVHTFSRFQINPYLEVGNYYYVRGNLKDFEVWGSNSPDLNDPVSATNEPGSSWEKIGTYHVTKPSGSSYQIETTADQQAAYNGWQFDFPTGLKDYRYIRVRQLSNWQGSYFLTIAELTLWGK